MPKIKTSQIENKQKDMSCYLRAYLKRAGRTQEQMSNQLGYTRQAFSYKLRTGRFDYLELLMMFDELNLSDNEILFLMKLNYKIS